MQYTLQEIAQIINAVLTEKFDYNCVKNLCFGDSIQSKGFTSVRKGEIFLHEGFPAKSVYFVLDGNVKINVLTAEGKSVTVDSPDAPHILGALEAVNNDAVYGASALADSVVTLARFTKDDFLQVLHANHEVAVKMVIYLSWLAKRNMDKSELKAISHPMDILIRFLYLSTVDKKTPHIVAMTRGQIAEELHINLRTLYRYLSTLQQKQFIQISVGKIIIDKKGCELLAQSVTKV